MTGDCPSFSGECSKIAMRSSLGALIASQADVSQPLDHYDRQPSPDWFLKFPSLVPKQVLSSYSPSMGNIHFDRTALRVARVARAHMKWRCHLYAMEISSTTLSKRALSSSSYRHPPRRNFAVSKGHRLGRAAYPGRLGVETGVRPRTQDMASIHCTNHILLWYIRRDW